MPDDIWENLYVMVCDRVMSTYPEFNCSKFEDGSIRAMYGPGISSVSFENIRFTLDDTVYEIPFDAIFKKMTPHFIYMYAFSKGDKFTLGMHFLKYFYQVHDMQRNQLALVPNIVWGDSLAKPYVIERGKFIIYVSCLTALGFLVLSFTANVNVLKQGTYRSSKTRLPETMSQVAQRLLSATSQIQSKSQTLALGAKHIDPNQSVEDGQ